MFAEEDLVEDTICTMRFELLSQSARALGHNPKLHHGSRANNVIPASLDLRPSSTSYNHQSCSTCNIYTHGFGKFLRYQRRQTFAGHERWLHRYSYARLMQGYPKLYVPLSHSATPLSHLPLGGGGCSFDRSHDCLKPNGIPRLPLVRLILQSHRIETGKVRVVYNHSVL